MQSQGDLPTACGTAGFTATGNARLALIWATMHVPVLFMRAFKGPAAMPVGAYMAGRRNCGRDLFALANWMNRKLV